MQIPKDRGKGGKVANPAEERPRRAEAENAPPDARSQVLERARTSGTKSPGAGGKGPRPGSRADRERGANRLRGRKKDEAQRDGKDAGEEQDEEEETEEEKKKREEEERFFQTIAWAAYRSKKRREEEEEEGGA
jgi:hypothetical protein